MPDADCAIFRTRDDYRKLWVKTYRGNIVSMSIECLHATFCLKVPNFNKLIVGARNKVRSVTTAEIFNTVHTLFVSFQGEVGAILSDRPNLDGPIE